jgi:hypothetical protein
VKIKSPIALTGLALLALSTLNPQLSTVLAQGTAFTYQGRLNDGGAPAHGTYDLRFKLYADAFGNIQAGGTLLTNGIPLTNGLFTVAIDFGAGIFNGSNYWLEVAVRTNGAGPYAALVPLQAVNPVPYAIFATTASNLSGTISSANLSGTYSGPVTLDNGGNSFNGSFTGNGAGVANVSAAALGGLGAANFWQTGGNAGTSPGVNFAGTTDNQPLELRVNGQRAMRFEPTTNNLPNLIGGISNAAQAGATGATIGGGVNNLIGTNVTLSVIGGGGANTVRPLASWATIAGGYANTVGSINDFIGGGWTNTIAAGNYAVIGGGVGNFIGPDGFGGAGHQAVIGGGAYNTNNEYYSFIGGGERNFVQGLADHSVIAGGGNNVMAGSYVQSVYSVIGGGYFNAMKTNTSYAVIGGGYANSLGTAYYQTIGGGVNNSIGTNANASTVGGGSGNAIQALALNSIIAGGSGNAIQTLAFNANIGGYNSTIAGGLNNLVGSPYATIGGGGYNNIGTNSNSGNIAGGYGNVIQNNTFDATIGGGSYGSIGTNSYAATITGGSGNSLGDNSGGASIGGGVGNVIQPSAAYAVIPGGCQNVAGGQYSFAAGRLAQAAHGGAFVWSDASSPSGFNSTANNQFLIRAAGGVGIGTNNPAAALHVVGSSPTNIALRIDNGGIAVSGAGIGTGTAAFVHFATGTNIVAGYITTIFNPLCDGDPYALLFVTHNWNPPGAGGNYETHPYSVYYAAPHWTIYNDDGASITNMTFNVLVVKR